MVVARFFYNITVEKHLGVPCMVVRAVNVMETQSILSTSFNLYYGISIIWERSNCK